MEEYLQALNPQQYDAVVYDDGPSLVIAGAGSGKTRVLTNKIMYLIQKGYDPRRILALTFTNKAANEMRERIAQLIGFSEASKLWMGTFHSMFLKILRFNTERIGFHANLTIYDTQDSKALIKAIIKDLQLNDKDYPVNTVMSIISSAKNALISPADYLRNQSFAERDKYNKRPSIANIYSIYQMRCKIANAMDFDDILYYTNVLFRDNEDVLEKYRNFFQYVLVDEYQDTNFAQHLIISKLSQANRKLCVVGDDAQSIYSFRGANISNILNLNRQYPDLKIFKLEQNYRSTQNILNAANSLIAKNTKQIPKRIFSDNNQGAKIQVIEAYSDFEESFIVANKISEMKMLQGGSYDDFAILYRTNAQSRVLEENLRKRNVPYKIYGGLSFYQRKEIKDALAYFRISVNPDDDEALCRIINYPTRGIGERTVSKLRTSAAENRRSIWSILNSPELLSADFNSGTKKKLDSFCEIIQGFIDESQQVDANELACKIYSVSGIVTSLYSENTPENISRQENLNELLNGIHQFVEENKERGDGVSMIDFLSEVSLATDQDGEEDDYPKVTLMTVHAAKGLEFRNIIVVGVEDELFPSDRAADIAEIEEERRLLYVAITRAKENCILTYAMTRYRNGQTHPCSRSRFINDIDPSLLAFPIRKNISMPKSDTYQQPKTWVIQRANRIFDSKSRVDNASSPKIKQNKMSEGGAFGVLDASELNKGTRVEHSIFGEGTVLDVDLKGTDSKVTIEFDNVGTKVLLTKYAKLAILK